MEGGFRAEGEENAKTLRCEKARPILIVAPKLRASDTSWARMKFSAVSGEMKTVCSFKAKVVRFQ